MYKINVINVNNIMIYKFFILIYILLIQYLHILIYQDDPNIPPSAPLAAIGSNDSVIGSPVG